MPTDAGRIKRHGRAAGEADGESTVLGLGSELRRLVNELLRNVPRPRRIWMIDLACQQRQLQPAQRPEMRAGGRAPRPRESLAGRRRLRMAPLPGLAGTTEERSRPKRPVDGLLAGNRQLVAAGLHEGGGGIVPVLKLHFFPLRQQKKKKWVVVAYGAVSFGC